MSRRNRNNPYNTTLRRAHAQLALALVFGAETSTLDDKKAALALAKECPAGLTAVGVAIGKCRGTDGKWS